MGLGSLYRCVYLCTWRTWILRDHKWVLVVSAMSKDKGPVEKVPCPGPFKKRVAEAGMEYLSLGQPWTRPASPGQRRQRHLDVPAQLDSRLLKQKVSGAEAWWWITFLYSKRAKKENNKRNVTLKRFHLERESCPKAKKLKQLAMTTWSNRSCLGWGAGLEPDTAFHRVNDQGCYHRDKATDLVIY